MRPQQLQMVVLNVVIYGGGASSGIFEFPTKKLIFITHIKPKTVKKMKFSAFLVILGARLGAKRSKGARAPQIQN